MNIKNNSSPDPEQILKELVADGTIDYGIITSGSCSTPEDQEIFDREQKGKPPSYNNQSDENTSNAA